MCCVVCVRESELCVVGLSLCMCVLCVVGVCCATGCSQIGRAVHEREAAGLSNERTSERANE